MPEVGQWGPQAFIDRIGRPTPYITITIYETDGTTPATLYADQSGSTLLANPLPTGVATDVAGVDDLGNGSFYAVPGAYVIAVDRSGVEVYRSPVTVAVDTGGGGGGSGLHADLTDLATSGHPTSVIAGLDAALAVLTAADATEVTDRIAGDAATVATAAADATAKVAGEAALRTAADALLIPSTEKGAASGVATLDGSGTIPTSQLPALAITETFVVGSQAAMVALAAQPGDVAIRTDESKSYILVASPATVLANWLWLQTPASPVLSVDGRTGAVSLSDLYDAAGAAAAAQAASQPLDADLTAISSLAGQTAYGRAFLALADAAAGQAALGLGSMALQAASAVAITGGTLTNVTLVTPTIASFANAQHDHTNAAGGGTIAHSALTGLTTGDPHTQYPLLAGRAGGQTLIGGTAANDDITITSTSNATLGRIVANSGIRSFLGNQTFTAQARPPFDLTNTYTLDFAATPNWGGNIGSAKGLLHIAPAIILGSSLTSSASIVAVALKNAMSLINNSALSGITLGQIPAVRSVPSVTSDTTTNTLGAFADFYSEPTYTVANGGTLNMSTDLVNFEAHLILSGANVNFSGTYAAFGVLAPTVTSSAIAQVVGFRAAMGTKGSTSLYGFEVGFGGAWGAGGVNRGLSVTTAPTGGTENTGIFNAGTLRQVAAAMFGVAAEPAAGVPVHVQQQTVGNEVMRRESVATNDDPIEQFFQARAATTDATVTSLFTFALPASTTVQVIADVVARRTGGSAGAADDGAGYRLMATYKNGAQIGATTVVAAHESVAGYDATLDFSGSTARVRVTGVVNTNITWHGHVTVRKVGT